MGGEVADLCSAVGFAPDPEQRAVLDDMFAFRAGGLVRVRDVGVVAPRQNMKTGLLKMAALGWLFLTEHRLTVWSAHEFGTAQEAFRDMVALIESHRDLEREVVAVHRASGSEAVELRGDRRLRFKARTKAGGRGLTGDRVILDEAMYLRADHLGALVPTLRAVRDPQLVYAGSAGLVESAVWRRVRDRGRVGDDKLAYWEWGDVRAWEGCSASECSHEVSEAGCALDDEARWWATNSALRSGRITVDTLRADRLLLPPIEFARETLGWWDDPPADVADDVLAGWPEVSHSAPALRDPVTLGIDVGHEGRAASIVACDGRRSLEVVEWRRGAPGWVPDRVAELRRRHRVSAVVLAGGSPAGALEARIPGVRVLPAGEQNVAQQGFAQAVSDGAVRQYRPADGGDTALDVAVRSAVRKLSGDGWRWSRAASRADISALLAAVWAVHVATVRRPKTEDELLRSLG